MTIAIILEISLTLWGGVHDHHGRDRRNHSDYDGNHENHGHPGGDSDDDDEPSASLSSRPSLSSLPPSAYHYYYCYCDHCSRNSTHSVGPHTSRGCDIDRERLVVPRRGRHAWTSVGAVVVVVIVALPFATHLLSLPLLTSY